MTARAERRRVAKAAATLVSKTAAPSDVNAYAELQAAHEMLQAQYETAKGYLRTYKAKEFRLAAGLGVVTRALLNGDLAASTRVVKVLMGTDLKDSKRYFDNRFQALDAAISALQARPDDSGCRDALVKIQALAPEHFGEDLSETVEREASA